jgi:hypothetical protein
MQVGSLVECINGEFDIKQISLIPNLPKRGKIYTIREIKEYPNKKTGLLLEEISNPAMDTTLGFLEPTFDIKRFKELPEVNVEEMIEELFEMV